MPQIKTVCSEISHVTNNVNNVTNAFCIKIGILNLNFSKLQPSGNLSNSVTGGGYFVLKALSNFPYHLEHDVTSRHVSRIYWHQFYVCLCVIKLLLRIH